MEREVYGVVYKPKGPAGEYGEWALNLFDGCDKRCVYCYVPSQKRMSREEFGRTVSVRQMVRGKTLIERVSSDLEKMAAAGVGPLEIFLCFSCDPFASTMLVAEITRLVIEMIHNGGHSIRYLTKCPHNVPWDVIGAQDDFGVTLVCASLDKMLVWEPGTFSGPFQRIGALAKAKELGCTTWASFEPVIWPEDTLRLIEWAAPYLDRAMIGKANHLGKWAWPSPEERARVEAIDWVGFRPEASALCVRLGLEYAIKEDLRKATGG